MVGERLRRGNMMTRHREPTRFTIGLLEVLQHYGSLERQLRSISGLSCSLNTRAGEPGKGPILGDVIG